MRKRSMFFYISLMCLILLMFFILLNDKTVGAQTNKTFDYTEEINNILRNRLEIINDTLFESENLDESFAKLSKIESEDALEWDTKYLEEIKNNPTDFSYVNDFEIIDMDLIDNINDRYIFKVKIKWNIDNISYETYEHDIEIINQEGKLYMTKFN